jgi:hypothetical protein
MVLNNPNNSFTFISNNNGNDNTTMELSTPIPSDNRHQMAMLNPVISFSLSLPFPVIRQLRPSFQPEQSRFHDLLIS